MTFLPLWLPILCGCGLAALVLFAAWKSGYFDDDLD